MKKILFLLLILASCNQNTPTQDKYQKNEPETVLDKTDSPQKSNNSSIIDEQMELIKLTKQYHETGDKKILQRLLNHWKNKTNVEYVETCSPLYCGLAYELMGDKTSALLYYKKSELLALRRIKNPFDNVEYEFGVKSEKELREMFKQANNQFSIEDYKEKKIINEKYWLYISQIALGKNKFKELSDLNLKETDTIFQLMVFEINERKDIFQLIAGFNN